jgi:hypothetical protein
MERVVFLVEETGERISCMLNPETLVVRRAAGVQRRQSMSGQLTGAGLSDDPLLYTGGGYTSIELDLLFDLDLEEPPHSTSVRRLTELIWQLSENSQPGGRYGSPPLVRFVWGKEWNMLGIVTAVAERFERFAPSGEPRRSWLRMRFVRVHENQPKPEAPTTRTFPTGSSGSPTIDVQGVRPSFENLRDLLPPSVPPEVAAHAEITATHILLGEGSEGENLPQIAQKYYGDPSLWRLIAWFNNIDQPLTIKSGTALLIPTMEILDQLRQWASNASPNSI